MVQTTKILMPCSCRCMKCQWVFKVKHNGVYLARLVGCVYSQIPGIDVSENNSPVVNNITFRVLLLIMMKLGFSAKVVDVKTGFLYGELEKEI